MTTKYRIIGSGSRSFVSLNDETKARIITDLKKYISDLYESHKDYDVRILSGMAEGWDETIARCANELNIPWYAIVPNPSYGDYYWKSNSVLNRNRIDEYNELLKTAQHVHYVCNNVYESGIHSNIKRNELLASYADIALVYDGNSPGTQKTIRLLNKANKKVVFFM